jgi:glycosyltransferase involved in cell wall biosynthesis
MRSFSNSNKPPFFLTVGIPAYENPSGLIRALNSVAKQNLKDLEILISDDHSRNRLEPFVESWTLKNPDISVRYHYQESNLHILRNKKWIIENALGVLIAFLEHDDLLIDPDFYSEAKKLYLNDSRVKAILANSIIESPLKDELLFKARIPKSDLVMGYFIYPPRKLMRKLLSPYHAKPLTISWSSLIFEKDTAVALGAFGSTYVADVSVGEMIEAFPHEEHMIFLALIHDLYAVAYSTTPKSFRSLSNNSFSRNFSNFAENKKYVNKVDFFNYIRASRLPRHKSTRFRLRRNAIYAGLNKSTPAIRTYAGIRSSTYFVIVLALLVGKIFLPFFAPILKYKTRMDRLIYLVYFHPSYLISRIKEKLLN